jgi:APA family basic amino acid/polyamine antiporter
MGSQLLATKSIDELHAQEASGNELRRALTANQLTLLGIGGVIGTGIFVLTGEAARAQPVPRSPSPSSSPASAARSRGCATRSLPR